MKNKLLAAIGFAVNLIAYYPGFMEPDTVDIYEQALNHHYRDWHPPAMAWFWGLLNHIHHGPQVMLIWQLGLLWMSFYLLATHWFTTKRTILWLFLGFFLAPFIQNFAGYIIGDSEMALTWVLAVSIILKAVSKQRPMNAGEAVCAFLLIGYGSLVRINALPGAIPLYYFWAANLFGKPVRRRTVLLSTALSIVFVFGAQTLIKVLLKPQQQHPEYKLFLHDIAGVYVKTGENYFPSFVTEHPGFDPAYLKANYTTATADNLYWNEERKFSFPLVDDSTALVMKKAWMQAIRQHPVPYIGNRLDGYLYYLRIKKRTWFVTSEAVVCENQYGFSFTPNAVSKAYIWWIKLHSQTPWMRPWFWLLVNIGLLMAAFRTRIRPENKNIILVLGISSLLYLLPQVFIFQVDTEFRYFYWNCLSIFIGVYFWAAGRLRA